MWKLYSRIQFSKNSQQCSVNLPDMPDEILLKIFNYLDWDILSILKLSQISKRFNAICQEESLWQKASLAKARIPTTLVQKILEKGCRYLRLDRVKLKGKLELTGCSQLKGLFIHDCKARSGVFEELLASCHSLKMLYLFRLALNSSMINSICQQNGKTLQTLKLRWSEGLELEAIKLITSQCTELTEVSFADTYLSEDSINIVSSQLTPKVMKLSLGGLWEVQDEHINMLVVRCNRLFELDIDDTGKSLSEALIFASTNPQYHN